jgi:hypothetical protein
VRRDALFVEVHDVEAIQTRRPRQRCTADQSLTPPVDDEFVVHTHIASRILTSTGDKSCGR